MNILLDTYAHLKIINKYKLRFNSKPWITLSLQKSISVKTNYLLNSLIRGTLYLKKPTLNIKTREISFPL